VRDGDVAHDGKTQAAARVLVVEAHEALEHLRALVRGNAGS
jgi:hypothetical protein